MDFDRRIAVKLSTTNAATYMRAYNLVSTKILHKTVDYHTLSVQFGCETIVEPVFTVESKFQSEYMNALDVSEKSILLERQNLVNCVIFFAVAKKLQVRLEKKKLVSIANSSAKEFDNLLKIVERYCDVEAKKIRGKRKVEVVLQGAGAQKKIHVAPLKAASGINSMICMNYAEKVELYQIWKQRIMTRK